MLDCLLDLNGQSLKWSKNMKFLGFMFLSGPNFKCNLQINKQKIFQSANTILGRTMSKEFNILTLSMIDKFCEPVLLYGLEALDNKRSTIDALDFVYNTVFVKMFDIKNKSNLLYCQNVVDCIQCRLNLNRELYHSISR